MTYRVGLVVVVVLLAGCGSFLPGGEDGPPTSTPSPDGDSPVRDAQTPVQTETPGDEPGKSSATKTPGGGPGDSKATKTPKSTRAPGGGSGPGGGPPGGSPPAGSPTPTAGVSGSTNADAS